MVIAVLGLLGYIPGLRTLGSVRLDYIPMAPSTAVSFLALGIILIFYVCFSWKRWVSIPAQIIAALIGLFGFLKFIEYFVGAKGSFEQIFVRIPEKLGQIPIGIMSPSTGGIFFLAGFAVLILTPLAAKKNPPKLFGNLAGILGNFVFLGGLVFALGYFYGQPFLYSEGSTVPMALTTAVAFLLLGIGTICAAGPGFFPLSTISGPSTSARLLRVFLPLAIVLVFAVDFLDRFIHETFHIDHTFTLDFFMIFFVFLTSSIVIYLGRALGDKLDTAEKHRKKIAEAKSELLAMVSHELRTPLYPIREGINIVLEKVAGEINEEQEKLLSTSKANIDRLTHLINNFLNFQRIDAGAIEFDFEENDINEIALEAQKRARAMIRNENLEIKVNLARDLPQINCDREKILQILINLLGNAIKFSNQGRINIKTALEENEIEVSVRDEGIGIKLKDLEHLFKSFTQLEDGKIKASGGVGLGLMISKQLVEGHGGKIRIRSIYREGTTVIFTLPLPAPQENM